MHWLVIVSLLLSAALPHASWADEAANLQKKMESVDEAPPEEPKAQQAAPAIPADPATPASTQPAGQATPFTPTATTTPLGTLVWDNSTSIAGGVLLTYLGGKLATWQMSSDALEANRAVAAQLRDAFPNGIDQRLKPQIDKIAAIEKSLGERIGEVTDGAKRRDLIDDFGGEVCAAHLAKLGRGAQAREAGRRYTERLGRWWRGGKSAPATEGHKESRPVDQTADAQVMKEIENDRARLREAYEEWYREVEKLKPEFRRITGKDLKMPAEPAKLMKADALPDQRGMRDAINDLNAYLASAEGRAQAAARVTLLEKGMGLISKGLQIQREQGTKALLREAGKAALHATGQGFAGMGSIGWQLARHPLQSARYGFGAVLGGAHQILTNPAPLIKRAPEFAAAAAFLWISGDVLVKEAKLKGDFQQTYATIAAEQRVMERDGQLASTHKLEKNLLILATTQTWKALASEGKIPETRDNGPFILKKEGSPHDTSATATLEMKNLVNAASETEKNLNISSYEALWVKLYQKKEFDPLKPVTGTQAERDKATYEAHKESIQRLAAHTGEFANHAGDALDFAYNLEQSQKAMAEKEASERAAAAKAAAEAKPEVTPVPVPVTPVPGAQGVNPPGSTTPPPVNAAPATTPPPVKPEEAPKPPVAPQPKPPEATPKPKVPSAEIID